jgi:hypothetical protein
VHCSKPERAHWQLHQCLLRTIIYVSIACSVLFKSVLGGVKAGLVYLSSKFRLYMLRLCSSTSSCGFLCLPPVHFMLTLRYLTCFFHCHLPMGKRTTLLFQPDLPPPNSRSLRLPHSRPSLPTGSTFSTISSWHTPGAPHTSTQANKPSVSCPTQRRR